MARHVTGKPRYTSPIEAAAENRLLAGTIFPKSPQVEASCEPPLDATVEAHRLIDAIHGELRSGRLTVEAARAALAEATLGYLATHVGPDAWAATFGRQAGLRARSTGIIP